MAEEAVRSTPKFFCHFCSGEVQGINADFTCAVCSSGFVEELPLPVSDPQYSRNNRGANAGRRNELGLIRDEIATLLLSRTGLEIVNNGTDSTGTNRRVANVARIQNFDRLDNILLEILNSLAVVGSEQPGSSTVFIGNPGDYAWGREGVDTIVTQLLNQMDTSGPPPLPKDEIDDIPTVDITTEQQKLQCSVCWDNFKLEEKVRKLPCSHIYHENCIIPWLRIHGTCPICRKMLTTCPHGNNSSGILNASNLDTNSLVRQAFGFESAVFNSNLPSLSNASNNTASTSVNVSRSNTNSTSSNSSRAGQQDPTPNSSSSNLTSQAFKFDDGNIEYDFD